MKPLPVPPKKLYFYVIGIGLKRTGHLACNTGGACGPLGETCIKCGSVLNGSSLPHPGAKQHAHPCGQACETLTCSDTCEHIHGCDVS